MTMVGVPEIKASKRGPAAQGQQVVSGRVVDEARPARPDDDSAEIVDALRTVHDPCCRDRGISVVDMGLVRSVLVGDGTAHVELMLTSGWCPFAANVLSSVKEKIESLPGIDHASVEITWDEAWTMDRLSDDARAKLVFLPQPASVADRDAYVRSHFPTGQGGPTDDR
jgi:metal-sulfur cluster biosynthetic enzyme